jgi:sec-independent protein translocase protein TatA
MFGLGSTEILLIFAVVALLFGATKLPDLARSMGKSMGEFKIGQIEAEKKFDAIRNSPLDLPRGEIALTRAQRMARNLGIDVTGKTDEQLLVEIEKKLDKN